MLDNFFESKVGFIVSLGIIFTLMFAIMELFALIPIVFMLLIIVESYLVKRTKTAVSKPYGDDDQTYGYLMSAEDKKAYLKSDEWQAKRKVCLLRDGFSCVNCGSKNNLHIHHISYEYLGKERHKDVATLCSSCHQRIHDKLGYSRFTKYPVSILKEN